VDKKKATRWTDEKVKALKLPEGIKERRTLVFPGLYIYLRQKADGGLAKQWQYRAQVSGKRRWQSLGSYPELGLAGAEKERMTHDEVRQRALKGEGEHPAIEAKRKRDEVKSNPSVEETFAEWIADKRLGSPRKKGKPVRERTVKLLQDSFDMDIRPVVGVHKVGKLTPASIRPCIERGQKRGSPGAATQVYRTLRGLVTFAISREYIKGADPMRGISNPRPYRPAPPNAANDAEIVHFLQLIGESNFDGSSRGIIELQLLTGMRPTECRLLQWSQVDLKKMHLELAEADVKTGKPFRVHLAAGTAQLLQQAKHLAGASNYVFPGRVKGKPLSAGAVGYALRRKWVQEGVDPGRKLKPHDLRKTFRTMLSRLGISGEVAGLCLNHTEEHVLRRIYDGHDYWNEMVDAWNRAAGHIERLRPAGAELPAFTRTERRSA
jgi:integrase